MKEIGFYYQKLSTPVASDDLDGLIALHEKSFTDWGWKVIRLDESDAKCHPLYSSLVEADSILMSSKNSLEYTRACYARWLAYAVSGVSFCDFDVMNYGFTPDDAREIASLQVDEDIPIFLSAATAIGLANSNGYEKILDTFMSFMKNPIIEGPLLEDVNDMTIMRHLRSSWYNLIPYSDPRFCRDYSLEGYESTKLVHYPHGLTPLPRVKTILEKRPLI
jgi:hypothetical protein